MLPEQANKCRWEIENLALVPKHITLSEIGHPKTSYKIYWEPFPLTKHTP